MYRPEGWDNPYRENAMAYEAGANAMLEALIRDGDPQHSNCGDECNDDKGYLVFIPKEE